MNLWWRTLLKLISPMRVDADPFDVVETRFRVLPTDLDMYGHMNNGRYLSISDIGRFDLLRRSGLWPRMRKLGWYPVVASSTITYRKSLEPWQRFVIESRFLGVNERDVYLEQRFVAAGEIYARQFIRGRFLMKSGGHVPMDELVALLGARELPTDVPAWLIAWGADGVLPSAKSSAPSEWD
ncbi:MAG: acyl-CoA thioesterase [Terrimesophilobacter sp.]